MINKTVLLTIFVFSIGALSAYVLSAYPTKVAPAPEFDGHPKLISEAGAAYIVPVAESTYYPLRDWGFLEPDIQAKAGVLYDEKSGKILYQKNLKSKLPIASVTKLLTAMIVLENIDLESKIKITEESLDVAREGSSDFYLNEIFYAGNLLKAMLIKSSNDAAKTFETHLAERGIGLVDEINKKAKAIGMDDSLFYDSAGLDDRGFSTVEDLIKLTNYSLRYPEIQNALLTEYVKINSADGKFSHDIKTTNKLLGIIPNIQMGKTGYTDEALGAMVLKVKLSGVNSSLIAAVLGSANRFSDVSLLINWAEQAHRWK